LTRLVRVTGYPAFGGKVGDYTIEEHRHRFAVWAAARAAQRGFRTVAVLREALEVTDLRSFLSGSASADIRKDEFDALHQDWCRAICEHLAHHSSTGVSFGRAAKLVAVYLKTMVIMGERWDSSLGRNAHPPIDRRLLKEPRKQVKDKNLRREWSAVNWTQLDEAEYYALVRQLRDLVLPAPFWTLEKHWQPSDREA
jgi:hypothetical protein